MLRSNYIHTGFHNPLHHADTKLYLTQSEHTSGVKAPILQQTNIGLRMNFDFAKGAYL